MGGLGITGIFCLVSPTLSAPTSGPAIGGGAFPAASPVRDFPPGIMVFTPLSPSSSHSSLSDNPKRERKRGRKALKSSSATEYWNYYYSETRKMCIFYIKTSEWKRYFSLKLSSAADLMTILSVNYIFSHQNQTGLMKWWKIEFCFN